MACPKLRRIFVAQHWRLSLAAHAESLLASTAYSESRVISAFQYIMHVHGRSLPVIAGSSSTSRPEDCGDAEVLSTARADVELPPRTAAGNHVEVLFGNDMRLARALAR